MFPLKNLARKELSKKKVLVLTGHTELYWHVLAMYLLHYCSKPFISFIQRAITVFTVIVF